MGSGLSAIVDILDQMAATLNEVMGPDALGENSIQVVGRLNLQPQSPTSVDIYPGDPFRDPESAGFGDIDGIYIFTVRARVTTPDADGAQDQLLALMDDENDLCLAAALESNPTLDGWVGQLRVDGNTGFRVFDDPPGSMLGCSWRVRVINAPS